jgi:hypothetical protein
VGVRDRVAHIDEASVLRALRAARPLIAVALAAVLVFIVATPFVWVRYGAGYGLYMAANLWLPLSSGRFEGLGRYCSVMFPFFILVAGLRSRRVFTSIMVAFAMVYTLCLALFTKLHPLY